MSIDLSSFLAGGAAFAVVAIVGLLFIITAIMGKAKTQIKYVLTKLYTRTSLMLMAMFDVVAAFDPSQTLLGLPLSLIAGTAVFFSEWGIHDNFKMNRIGIALIVAFIGAILVVIPTPIAGLFVAWFGLVGDKKKK
jgi:hypothetical protein